ncbi:unnamed protein product [Peniophora sp. CBMAI 1063]|nr:unnamed protein product [Peniophora sp. CBMAI 1063]
MGAVDHTYPLHPIACVVGAVMLLVVIAVYLIRRRWNLVIFFLASCLAIENLMLAANEISWFSDASIKLHAYCDIFSHFLLFCYIVRALSTLLITRRLYIISGLRTTTSYETKGGLILTWVLELAVPAMIAGPLYYVVQTNRFDVVAGFGCVYALDYSFLTILLVGGWGVVFPLISILIYYPKVAYFFYSQSREAARLRSGASNSALSRADYLRIFALSSIDILLTLPTNVIVVALAVLDFRDTSDPPPFYSGWDTVHADWTPQVGKRKAYFDLLAWMAPVTSFALFAIFGFTPDARAAYSQVIRTAKGWLGWKPNADTPRTSSVTSLAFGRPAQEAGTAQAASGVTGQSV